MKTFSVCGGLKGRKCLLPLECSKYFSAHKIERSSFLGVKTFSVDVCRGENFLTFFEKKLNFLAFWCILGQNCIFQVHIGCMQGSLCNFNFNETFD